MKMSCQGEMIISTKLSGSFDYVKGRANNTDFKDTMDKITESLKQQAKRNDKETDSDDCKVGRYNLNDILGFNRPKLPRI